MQAALSSENYRIAYQGAELEQRVEEREMLEMAVEGAGRMMALHPDLFDGGGKGKKKGKKRERKRARRAKTRALRKRIGKKKKKKKVICPCVITYISSQCL